MDSEDLIIPGLMLIGVFFYAGMHEYGIREMRKRNFKGTIGNCEVVRDAKYSPGWCSDCPDTPVETLDVRCKDQRYFYTDIQANGKVDRVTIYKDGKLMYTGRRDLGKTHTYQALFKKWQKKIDEY